MAAMADRSTLKHAFKLAAAVMAIAADLLECLAACEREAIRDATRARRQAGHLMAAVRRGDPADSLRRYERGLTTWLERFA